MTRADGQQQQLFPGNRGCGKKARGAADPIVRSDRIVIRIDGLRLASKLNARFATKGAIFANAKRTKEIRVIARHQVEVHSRGRETPKLVILTRLAPRQLDAFDNLPGSLKPVLDGVADAFDVNDRDLIVEARQMSIGPKRYGVMIELLFDTP